MRSFQHSIVPQLANPLKVMGTLVSNSYRHVVGDGDGFLYRISIGRADGRCRDSRDCWRSSNDVTCTIGDDTAGMPKHMSQHMSEHMSKNILAHTMAMRLQSSRPMVNTP